MDRQLLINVDNLIDLLECIQDANKGMTQEVEKTIDEVITIIYDLEAGNSNTQLYKQAGNSIVKNVLCEVFKQMM